jgi:hypothetical protein
LVSASAVELKLTGKTIRLFKQKFKRPMVFPSNV